jgi:hypothetical protein
MSFLFICLISLFYYSQLCSSWISVVYYYKFEMLFDIISLFFQLSILFSLVAGFSRLVYYSCLRFCFLGQLIYSLFNECLFRYLKFVGSWGSVWFIVLSCYFQFFEYILLNSFQFLASHFCVLFYIGIVWLFVITWFSCNLSCYYLC